MTTASPRRNGQSDALALLSAREREVLAGLVRGMTNKQVGLALGISHRTVEVHRAKLMRKVGARNLAALLDIAFPERDNLPVLRTGD